MSSTPEIECVGTVFSSRSGRKRALRRARRLGQSMSMTAMPSAGVTMGPSVVKRSRDSSLPSSTDLRK